MKKKRFFSFIFAIMLLLTIPFSNNAYAESIGTETEESSEMTESAVTGEAIEEATTQIPEVITQVPNSTTEKSDGGDIMPIDLVEHGKIKVKRTEDKDNVNNWLKRGTASGSYFDSDNHYFYVVSGTDETTGRNVSTVAYCLQSNKTGPDDDGEVEYEEGRGSISRWLGDGFPIQSNG